MPRVRYNKIPLRRRDGTVRAYALVDPGDYARFSKQRWSLQATGYAQGWDGKNIRTLHRMIFDLPVGLRVLEVDHINGDKLDNRRANLRVVHRQQNKWNYHKPRRNNAATGVLNVTRNGTGYCVRVAQKYIGQFHTLEEAEAAAVEARAERKALIVDLS